MRKPFYRKGTKAWYVWEGTGKNRKCIRLAKDKNEALRIWHERQSRTVPIAPDPSVRDIIQQFLEWCENHRSETTTNWYRHYLDKFTDHFGQLKVSQLKVSHVEDWLDECFGDCSNTGKNGAIRAVVRPFNFAVSRDVIVKNPIKSVERPMPEAREVYIEPEQWQTLINTVDDPDLHDLLIILRETGCRPHEARTVTADYVDRTMRAWVFPTDKSKGKRHRRVVPLTDRAWEITQRLMLKHPDGPFFRTKGKPWAKDNLCRRMQRLSKKTGIKATPYVIRHTFVTDALVNGVDPVTLSQIIGHRSLEMIQRVYAHVGLRQDHIQTALRKAVGS